MYCMAVRRPMELMSFFVNWRKMSVYSDLIGCRKTRRPVKYERVYKQTSINAGRLFTMSNNEHIKREDDTMNTTFECFVNQD